MDRTAQLRGKYQSSCKSHGSTCICRGTRQDPSSGRCCSANCTGPAAVYTWSPLEPRPVMPRRRPWQKYRKPTGVISSVTRKEVILELQVQLKVGSFPPARHLLNALSMSELGQNRKSALVTVMSAFPPI